MNTVVDSVSSVISPTRIKYDGVRPADHTAEEPLKWEFNVLYKKEDSSPRIFLEMYWNGNSDHSVELEDCLPLSVFDSLSLSTSSLITIVEDSPTDVLSRVLSVLAASIVSLKVKRVGEQIRFSVRFENFNTEATIEAVQVKEFLTLTHLSS